MKRSFLSLSYLSKRTILWSSLFCLSGPGIAHGTLLHIITEKHKLYMKLLEIVLFGEDVHWRRDAVTQYLCCEQGCNYRLKPFEGPIIQNSSTSRGLRHTTTLKTLKQVSTASSCLICVHVTLYSAYISCKNEEYTGKKKKKKKKKHDKYKQRCEGSSLNIFTWLGFINAVECWRIQAQIH